MTKWANAGVQFTRSLMTVTLFLACKTALRDGSDCSGWFKNLA